jgi:hypothetical protein
VQVTVVHFRSNFQNANFALLQFNFPEYEHQWLYYSQVALRKAEYTRSTQDQDGPVKPRRAYTQPHYRDP